MAASSPAPVTPYRTHEVRWFWPGPIAGEVEAWFGRLGPAVEPESRTDRYLAPTSDALGVKLREGNVEAKRREGTVGGLAAGGAEAEIEAWAKWSFDLVDAPVPDDGWVVVKKTRRQRVRQTAGAACALELATLEVAGETWTSICLEAHGPDADARRAALEAGARAWLDRPDAPALSPDAARSYPAWLRSRR